MSEYRNHKKALSLVEMLVVLLIMSTTILTALGLILRSSLEIKENEVRDSVNGIILNINESMKSPSAISLNNFTPNQFVAGVEYGFRVNPDGANYELTYVQGSTSLTSCDSQSTYRYTINVSQSTIQDICILVTIRRLQGTVSPVYEIRTSSLYTYNQPGATPVSSYLVTYRYNEFEI